MTTSGPRTIDVSLPPRGDGDDVESTPRISDPPSGLPFRCDVIHPSSSGLRDCALHQIRALHRRSEESPAAAATDSQPATALLSPEDEDALDDGFFLCDLTVVEGKLRAWRELFPRIKPFYALKCNPDAMVAAVLGRHSAEVGFDCASVAEIKLALQSAGGNARRCVYANPQRAESDLASALDLGVEALTFDGAEELRKVRRVHDERCRRMMRPGRPAGEPDPEPPEVILRLLVPDGKSSVPLGEKFGAKPADVAVLTEEAIDLGLPVIGVSFHCGSGCHDPEAFGAAIVLAKAAIDVVDETKAARRERGVRDPRLFQKCTLLDIGGGFPGLDGAGGDSDRFCGRDHGGGRRNTPPPGSSFSVGGETVAKIAAVVSPLVDRLFPVESSDVASGSSLDVEGETAAKIAAVVSPLVDRLFPAGRSGMHIISEPGRYFVESSFALCSRIYSSRVDSTGRHHYYIAQGVQGVFKDVLLCGETFSPIPLPFGSWTPERTARDAIVEVASSGTAKIANFGAEPAIQPDDDGLFPSTVRGPSGEDFDVVCADCLLPELSTNDWLLFDRMGAYTLSIAAKSGSVPVRYVRRGQ